MFLTITLAAPRSALVSVSCGGVYCGREGLPTAGVSGFLRVSGVPEGAGTPCPRALRRGDASASGLAATSLADAVGVTSSTVRSAAFFVFFSAEDPVSAGAVAPVALADCFDDARVSPPDRARSSAPSVPRGAVPLVEPDPVEEAASGLALKNSCQDSSTEDGSWANRSYISSTSHWFCPNCETLLLTILWCLSDSVVGFTRQWVQARPSARSGLSDLT